MYLLLHRTLLQPQIQIEAKRKIIQKGKTRENLSPIDNRKYTVDLFVCLNANIGQELKLSRLAHP